MGSIKQNARRVSDDVYEVTLMLQTIRVDFFDKCTKVYLGTRFFTKKINDEPDEPGNRYVAKQYSQEWDKNVPLPKGDE